MKLQVMNQEEFDNRLGESFKNEFLPPDNRLWENISSRIDNREKKPFWFWVLPIILVVAVGAWIANSLLSDKRIIAKETTVLTNSETSRGSANAKTSENSISDSDANGNSSFPATTISNKNYDAVETNNSTTSNNVNSASNANSSTQNNSNNGSTNNSTNTPTDNNSNIVPSQTPLLPIVTIIETDINTIASIPFSLKGFKYPLITQFEVPHENEITLENRFSNAKMFKSAYSKNPVDFDKSWWWSAGFGPQISENSANVPSSIQNKVHKDLWAAKSGITRKGTGFQTQFTLGYKFNKYFSIESGLQYSLHTEDIRFNLTSYDIPTRDQDNVITGYERLRLTLIIYNQNTMKYDSTKYDAVSNYALAVKNKYNIYTVPLRLNGEINLTPQTKLVGGIGMGLSYLRSKKSTHLDLINGVEEIEGKRSLFTASANAQVTLLTNINDVGQLGVYSGFQMYGNSLHVIGGQYSIRMSDLQFGFCFRRPLNWGR